MKKEIFLAVVMTTITLSPAYVFAKAEKMPKPGSHARHHVAEHHRSSFQMQAPKSPLPTVLPNKK